MKISFIHSLWSVSTLHHISSSLICLATHVSSFCLINFLDSDDFVVVVVTILRHTTTWWKSPPAAQKKSLHLLPFRTQFITVDCHRNLVSRVFHLSMWISAFLWSISRTSKRPQHFLFSTTLKFSFRFFNDKSEKFYFFVAAVKSGEKLAGKSRKTSTFYAYKCKSSGKYFFSSPHLSWVISWISCDSTWK